MAAEAGGYARLGIAAVNRCATQTARLPSWRC